MLHVNAWQPISFRRSHIYRRFLMTRELFARTVGVLLVFVFFSGCAVSTRMTVNTVDPDGNPIDNVTVKVDGRNIGTTPNAKIRVSNFAGTSTEIAVSKNGYETVKTEAVKEVKPANVVLGIMLNFFSWMWVYGAKPEQNIILTPAAVIE